MNVRVMFVREVVRVRESRRSVRAWREMARIFWN